MNRIAPRVRVAAAALLLLIGCGEDSSDAPMTPPGNPLEGVELSVGTATSLDRVYVEGLPSGRGEPYRLLLLAAEEEIELLLDEDGDGRFFHAPPHPDTPNAGGTARLVVAQGEHRSAEMPLELEPLPAAPGAYADLVAALRALVEQRAQWGGTTFDALRGQSFQEVDPSLIPLKMAQTTIDSPDESNDLTDLITNDTGYLSADQRELLDRYCGLIGMADLVQYEIDEFQSAVDTLPQLPPLPRVGAGGSLARGTCIDVTPTVPSVEALSGMMMISALADLYAGPDGPNAEAWITVGAVVGGLGTLPVPGLGGGAAIVAVGLGAVQMSGQYLAAQYPNHFVSIDYDLDRSELLEDDPGFARWSNVEVVAGSSGWSADGSIANIVISAIGGVLSEVQELGILDSFLRNMLITDINLGLGAFLDGFESDIVEFCPGRWTVDITDLPYSTAQALNRRLDVDPATRQIRPAEAGEDYLRVSPVESKFGGRTIFGDFPMLVKQIIVRVTPDVVFLESPGDPVAFTTTIENADNESLGWDPEHGSWADGIGNETNGPGTRTLNTPTSESAYPFLVVIESLSRQGARADGKPPRRDIAEVRLEGPPTIRISPPFRCIGNSETLQFTAEVTGEENPEIFWFVHTGWGEIDVDTGLYTAPPQGSTDDIIVAELVGHDGVSDYANVRVGACSCFYELEVNGAVQRTLGGGDIAFDLLVVEDELYTLQFIIQIPDGPGGGTDELIGVSWLNDGASDAPVPGEQGSYRVNFLYGVPLGPGWTSNQDEDDHTGVTMHVDSFTTTVIEGSLTGTAVQRDPKNPDQILSTIFIDMPFRAGYFDGSWPCTD